MRRKFRTLITGLILLRAATVPLHAEAFTRWCSDYPDPEAKTMLSPQLADYARSRRYEDYANGRKENLKFKLALLSLELKATNSSVATGSLLNLSDLDVLAVKTKVAKPNLPPVIRLNDITVEIINDCAVLVRADAFDDGSTDADGDALSFSFFEDGEELHDYTPGEYIVKIEVTDGESFSQASAKLKVVDKVLPLAVAVSNLKVPLSASGEAVITAAQLDGGSSDNCGAVSFQINQSSFSCEHLGDNQVTLTVTDSHGNEASTQTTVTIEDVIAPAIADAFSFSVDENADNGTVVGSFGATDICNYLDYVIQAGNLNGAFSINSSGHLLVANAAALDYENLNEYTLQVAVSDESFNSTTTSVVVVLNNLNDNEPVAAIDISAGQEVLEDAPYSYEIPEGTFTDADAGDILVYSATALPAWLSFDENSRTLSGIALNEHVGVHTVTILATDGAGHEATQVFSINVINTNDAPQAIALSNNYLVENEPAGTLVATLTGQDVDAGDVVFFSLENGAADNSYFVIEGNSLSTARPLNFEEKDHYSIHIVATDQAGAAYTAPFTISVADVPDSNPFLPNLFSPNGDDSNDFFVLRAYGVEQVHFQIFNKQGKLVYETTNVAEATEQGWDGTTAGKAQPAGTYVWKLSGRHSDGKPLAIGGKTLGNITLIR